MTKFINLGSMLIKKKMIDKIVLISDIWKWQSYKHEGLAPEEDYKYRFNITFEYGFKKVNGWFRKKRYIPNLVCSVYLKTKKEAKEAINKLVKLCEMMENK